MPDMNANFDKLHRHWRHRQDMVWTLTKAFVLGCGKSGTTWLVNLLNGHEQVAIRGEGCFAYQLVPLMQQAFGGFNKHQTKYRKDPASVLQPLDQLMLCRTAVDALLAHYLEAADKDVTKLRVIGDKTPQHAVTLELLAQVYPDARYIHIVRDPRDVAVSGWFHQGHSSGKSFEAFVEHFITTVWPLHVGGVRKAAPGLGERLLELRYDDLHADPSRQVQRMLAHLGVDSLPAATARCIDSGRFERLSGGRERGSEDRGNFYRKGVVGDWVHHLPRDLAQRCCDRVADLMNSYGYNPDCRSDAPAKAA
jgi:LPS sulfotransferase NodH